MRYYNTTNEDRDDEEESEESHLDDLGESELRHGSISLTDVYALVMRCSNCGASIRYHSWQSYLECPVCGSLTVRDNCQ